MGPWRGATGGGSLTTVVILLAGWWAHRTGGSWQAVVFLTLGPVQLGVAVALRHPGLRPRFLALAVGVAVSLQPGVHGATAHPAGAETTGPGRAAGRGGGHGGPRPCVRAGRDEAGLVRSPGEKQARAAGDRGPAGNGTLAAAAPDRRRAKVDIEKVR